MLPAETERGEGRGQEGRLKEGSGAGEADRHDNQPRCSLVPTEGVNILWGIWGVGVPLEGGRKGKGKGKGKEGGGREGGGVGRKAGVCRCHTPSSPNGPRGNSQGCTVTSHSCGRNPWPPDYYSGHCPSPSWNSLTVPHRLGHHSPAGPLCCREGEATEATGSAAVGTLRTSVCMRVKGADRQTEG